MAGPTPSGPSSEPPPPKPGPRRRELLVGGAAGLLGGFGFGVGFGRRIASPAPPPKEAPAKEASPPGKAFTSYAQCGEDLIIGYLHRHFGISRPTYLDIGAYDPVSGSNTYLLYTDGSRGLLVEPNPALADRIRSVRPGDRFLPAGIGVTDATQADFFMFNDDQLNTFDPDQVKRVAAFPHVRLEKTVKVPLVNINRAIAEHLGGKAPDLLSIDIEGLDLAVLKTLDFGKYRPKLVCAETLITATLKHNPETTPFMVSHGYEVRGMTFANTIYVDNKLLGK